MSLAAPRAVVVGFVLATAAVPAQAQTAVDGGTVIWQGVYTAEQAERGGQVMREVCAACHTAGDFGNAFLRRWSGRPVYDLFDFVRKSMPKSAPGSLTREQYTDVLAYVLSLFKAPAGSSPLPEDDEGLKRITIVRAAP